MWKIGLAIGALIALSTGGYFANEYRVCSGLEEDYLNDLNSLRTNVDARIALSSMHGDNSELVASFAAMEDAYLSRIQSSLIAIYDRCGTRAGRSAGRKGTDVLY